MMKGLASRTGKAVVTFGLVIFTLLGQKSTAQAPAFTKSKVNFLGDTKKSKTGELYTPKAGKPGTWPGIVLVHGMLGVTDLIRTEAGTLAAHGYLVLVVDLYEGKNPSSSEDGEKLWAELNQRAALTTCEGALGYLQNWSMDPENMGAVGWGDGGSLVLDMAEEQRGLRAVVDFGGLPTLSPERFRAVASRVLVEDQMVPDETKAIKFLDAHMKQHRTESR